MKIPSQKLRREPGFILLSTLGFVLVIGITLGSYLLLVRQEDQTVVRSQCWNNALAMAEAGVDEALAQMNASPNDFSANGWGPGAGATTYGPVSRTLMSGSYTTRIVIESGVPTIYSTGSTSVPGTDQQVSRTVKVTVTSQQQSPFIVGLGAVGNINMNGNGMATASWDSMTNTLSSNGLFVATLISTNGDVASVLGIVDIGNHTINGNLYLGPTASYASGSNQVAGTIYYDYNVQFPPATLPTSDNLFGSGNTISWLPAPVTSGGKSSTNTFTSNGYYYVNNSNPIYVAPGVTSVVQVATTSFNPSFVNIGGGTTNSGTLIIYQDSGSATLGGNSGGGAIGNRPENFIYYGLTNVTSVTLSGTSTFIGAIYAPEATLTLNGGGKANNLEGSAIVYSATMNGHYNIWYDEALANWVMGPSRGYIPTSWQEI